MSGLFRVRAIRDRRRNERGAMAIVIALITCFTLIPMGALAVDIGVQRVARRDAQDMADVVALDLARQLDGRTYDVINPTLQGLANKSLARNNASGMTVTAVLGSVDSSAYDPTHPYAYFTAAVPGSTTPPTAVEVTVSGSVTFSLKPGTGSVSRSAIGTSKNTACFHLGSYAAEVNSGDSSLLAPLNNLLGLNLSLLSYKGLAGANLSLADLAADTNIGSVDQLFSGNVTLDKFTAAAISVLNNQNNPNNAVAISALQAIRASGIDLSKKINIADVISVQKTDTTALASSFNVLDLIAGALQVADGTHALTIPTLTGTVPGVSSVTASMTVIEKPQGACDDQTATTNQVSLDVTFTLLPSASGLGGLLGLKSGVTTLKVHAAIAPATGKLAATYCVPKGADVQVTSALTSLTAEVTTDLTLLGLPIAKLDSTATSSAGTKSTTVQFRLPPDSLGVAKSAGSGTAVPTITVANGDVTLLGAISLGPLVGALTSGLITPLVNPLIANVNSILLGPIATLLGLKLGGADVFLDQLVCGGAVSLSG